MSPSSSTYPKPPRAFISYARADGEAFATALRHRLELEEPEITLWQDRARLVGGIGWWRQITEALDHVQFLIMVMTPAAFTSDVAIKEWRYARQQGVRICPVFGVSPSELSLKALPSWIRKVEIYNLDKEWETFVAFLKSPPHADHVPFMAPDLREEFVPRPAEFNALFVRLLDPSRMNPIALTTALKGAGGFGKTTLAVALCHHEDVISAFDDGILWSTLGETPKIQDELTKLYAALTGERPQFIDVDDASIQLAERLDQKNCLIVIDDAWDPNHVKPFLRGGKHCARLITTRHRLVVAESGAEQVTVDEMTEDQSVQLLTARLPTAPGNMSAVRVLARGLGEWPLLLRLAASLWVERVQCGQSVDGALEYVARMLKKRGVTGFDRHNAVERNDAVSKTMAVSLERLSPEDRKRCAELAIFPENKLIPIGAAGALWELDEFDADEVLQRLHGQALLDFDLKTGTLRIHDVLQQYLRKELRDPGALHARLVHGAWKAHYELSDSYAWRWIGWHLYRAGETDRLRSLLTDVKWLQAKLRATDVQAVLQDFELLANDSELRLVQDAIRLSAHGLSRDVAQLPAQLAARLERGTATIVDNLLDQCDVSAQRPWFRLRHASLTHAGGAMASILKGHSLAVAGIALLPGTNHAVTASADRTLRVWDLTEGRTIRILEGHRAAVHCVAVSAAGNVVLSGSEDRVIVSWDMHAGQPMRVLRGHHGGVVRISISPDGRQAVTVSDDATVRHWDLATGQSRILFKGYSHQLCAITFCPNGRNVLFGAGDSTMVLVDVATSAIVRTFEGHSGLVRAVAVSPNGNRAVSGCADGTLRLWDMSTAQTLMVFEGHAADVECVALAPDGTRVVAGSRDHTIRVWDLGTGATKQVFQGHAGFVRCIAITSDGTQAISTSGDQTVRQWNLSTRQPESAVTAMYANKQSGGWSDAPLLGHQPSHVHPEPVSRLAISVDGKWAISGSRTAAPRIWNIDQYRVIGALHGHKDTVSAIFLSPEGDKAITAATSRDRTLRVWDVGTREATQVLAGHREGIVKIAVSWLAGRVVSLARDRTLRLWDFHTGRTLRELVAISGEQLDTYRRIGRALLAENEVVAALDRVDTLPDRDARIAIASNGNWAAIGSGSNLFFWNLRDGTVQIEALGDFEVCALVAASDAKHVIVGSTTGVVALWDVTKSVCTRSFESQRSSQVLDVALSSSGERLFCALRDGTIIFWNLNGRSAAGLSVGGNDEVDEVVIMPDGALAYSVYGDTIVVSDLRRGQRLGSVSLDHQITSLSVVPEGTLLAAGDESGSVHFLQLGK